MGEKDGACADYVGRGTHAGTEAQNCRANYQRPDRRRTRETRKYSRSVSRRGRDELRGSGRLGRGSETDPLSILACDALPLADVAGLRLGPGTGAPYFNPILKGTSPGFFP